MTSANIMHDETYQPVLYMIERCILTYDKIATEQGQPINDSQVRSILTKVRKTAEGGTPKIPASSPREKILAELHEALVSVLPEILEEGENPKKRPLPVPIWTLCLQTVEESIQRRSSGPGSRFYLEFIAGYFPDTSRLIPANLSSAMAAKYPGT